MTLRLAVVAAALLFAPTQAIAAEPVSAQICELHVSGAGYPERLKQPPKKSMFVKVDNWSPPDFADPLSPVSVWSTSRRASDLPDEKLLALLPNASEVRIIRHPEMIDLDKVAVKKTRERLYDSDAQCYADLVILQLSAIWPNPDQAYQQAGLVGALIAGGNRAVGSYWMQVHSEDRAKPLRFKKRMDSPIASPPSDTRMNPERMIESMNSSNADMLDQFVEHVRKKWK